jgi:hypothetical protein
MCLRFPTEEQLCHLRLAIRIERIVSNRNCASAVTCGLPCTRATYVIPLHGTTLLPLLLLFTAMGWGHNETLPQRPFLIYCPPEQSGSYQQAHLAAKQKKLGEKWPLNFAYEASLKVVGFFNMPQILRHGTLPPPSPRKEVVLRIFSALKNPSSSARFNPRMSGPMTSTLALDH